MKQNRTIRFDKAALDSAALLGVDVNEVCRQALDRRLHAGELDNSDLRALEVALRLRVEACEDNNEKNKAKKWEALRKKVLRLLGAERLI
jgi:hypothetical protein